MAPPYPLHSKEERWLRSKRVSVNRDMVKLGRKLRTPWAVANARHCPGSKAGYRKARLAPRPVSGATLFTSRAVSGDAASGVATAAVIAVAMSVAVVAAASCLK